MKLDTAARRLTSAEGEDSPHAVSAVLLWFLNSLLNLEAIFAILQWPVLPQAPLFWPLQTRSRLEASGSVYLVQPFLCLMVIIIQRYWVWMTLLRSPFCRCYSLSIHFHCTSVNFLFDSQSVLTSMFSFRPVSAVLSVLPVHTRVGLFKTKLAKAQTAAALGERWSGIAVTGQRNADVGLRLWVCGWNFTSVFLPVKTHFPEKHAFRSNSGELLFDSWLHLQLWVFILCNNSASSI